MISFLRGIVYSSDNNQAVIDVSGVGYAVGITLNTFAKLPECGSEVFLNIYHHITEGSQSLFGFLSEDERSLFVSLLSINKVGPKVALNILSGMSIERLVMAVEGQDVGSFKGVSGVGPKTAQRIVLELKGKLDVSIDTTAMAASTSEKVAPLDQSTAEESYTALIALGYTDAQIRPGLARVAEAVDEKTPTHEWITTALKLL